MIHDFQLTFLTERKKKAGFLYPRLKKRLRNKRQAFSLLMNRKFLKLNTFRFKSSILQYDFILYNVQYASLYYSPKKTKYHFFDMPINIHIIFIVLFWLWLFKVGVRNRDPFSRLFLTVIHEGYTHVNICFLFSNFKVRFSITNN